MYNIKNKKNEELFISLMDALKKTNLDWINLRKSRNYRVGMGINTIFYQIKKFDFKGLIKNINKWWLGLKKEKKYRNKVSMQNINVDSNYFNSERIAVYTCIFGNYDKILEPYFIPDNCDFYIFTDQNIDQNSIWKKLDLPREILEMSNIEKNRYIKMFPNLFFESYKYSIYLDGNVQIITDLTEYVNKINPKVGIAIHKHHLRDCVFDELVAVTLMNKKNKELALKYKTKLENDKMPKNYGLLQCNVIARIHNNKTCKKIMTDWWKEFEKNIKRDQVSLPYVLFKNGISVDDVGTLGNNIYTNPSFRINTHK